MFTGMYRDPNSPMWVIFTDSWAQCRDCLYTWMPRVRAWSGFRFMQEFTTLHCMLGGVGKEYKNPNPLNGTVVEASDKAQRMW